MIGFSAKIFQWAYGPDLHSAGALEHLKERFVEPPVFVSPDAGGVERTRAYAVYVLTRSGVVIPCANLTAEERARLEDETVTRAERATDAVQDNAPAAYAIYMFDPAKQTFLGVASPPPGFMYTDPIALQPREEPRVKEPTSVDATLAAQNLGVLEVRSVYDTDGLQRMGETVLAAADLGGDQRGHLVGVEHEKVCAGRILVGVG